MGLIQSEPVGVGAAVTGLAGSVLNAGALLGWWHLTSDAVAALNLVVANAVLVVSAFVVRSKVTPVSKAG